MKKQLSFAAAVIAASFSICFAQTPEHRQEVMDLLREDPTRSVTLHHNYEVPDEIVDTPAPKGYKPFYISHYGRHGSRYHYTGRYLTTPIAVLDSLQAHGLLTDAGREVLGDLRFLLEAHDGQLGYLTHKGAAQHRGISQRMYERYPEVFNQKDRPEVYCVATHVPRCIQSMANFCTQLSGNNPALDITMDAGERFGRYLCNTDGVARASERELAIMDSVLVANLDPSRLLGEWTVEPQEALKYIGEGNACRFIYDVFWAGSTAQCLDIETPDMFRYYTPDELYACWSFCNVRYYDNMNATVENHRSRDLVGDRNLRDILEKADAALAGNGRAADLRFGHDTGLTPIYSSLRLRGFEQEYPMASSIDGLWYGFEVMPMASNIQFIFYRNRGGDVLVKILRNEKETCIPVLEPVTGPYYSWGDLREFIETQIRDLNE